MTLIDSTLALQHTLDEAGIASIVIGGLAVAVWGDPRLTRDADFKVLLGRHEVERLLRALGAAYRPLDADPGRLLRDVGFAFFRDRGGTRLDLLLADTSFDHEAVSRGVMMQLAPGKKARISTAEDLIVYKLISTRSRDHEDARGIARRQRGALDAAYVEHWLAEFEAALDDSTLLSTFRELVRPR